MMKILWHRSQWILSSILLAVFLISIWPVVSRTSLASILDALEQGKFKEGSNPCCVAPVAVERKISEDRSIQFAKWTCKSGGRQLRIFFKCSTDELMNGDGKWEAFAAIYHTGNGSEKIYFYNHEAMGAYNNANVR
jgi:hypothetical protein